MDQYNFPITDDVAIMIRSSDINSAIETFKVTFGEFLYKSSVKYIEIIHF